MEIFTPTLIKVLAILAIIPFGYFLKQKKVVHEKYAPLLRELFVNVALPATVFVAFSSIELKKEYIYFPLIGLGVVVGFALISFFIANVLKLKKTVRTVFLIIMPTLAPATVAYPFFMSLYGEQGLVSISLFNVGNILFLFSVEHFIISKLSNHGAKIGRFLKDFLKEPVIWATIAGLLMSYFKIRIQFMHDFFQVVSNATVFIIMMMLGISLHWKTSSLKYAIPMVLTKTGVGLLLGYWFTTLFGFTGLDRLSLIIFSLVPPSAVTYIFVAAESKLSAAFEAELLAIALPIGAVLTGILITLQDAVLMQSVWYLGIGCTLAGLITLRFFGKK